MPNTRTGAGADVQVSPAGRNQQQGDLPQSLLQIQPPGLLPPVINQISQPPSINIPNFDYQNINANLHSRSTIPNAVHEVRSTPELDTLVTSIVSRVLEEQGKQLLENAINPNAKHFYGIDQTIYPQFQNDFDGLDKVPDVVRCLRNFSGEPGEFSSWKKSVERILKMYDNTRGTPKYYGTLNAIRNKIIGEADAALESFNTPLNWESIVNCLMTHYADKRDTTTLEY